MEEIKQKFKNSIKKIQARKDNFIIKQILLKNDEEIEKLTNVKKKDLNELNLLKRENEKLQAELIHLEHEQRNVEESFFSASKQRLTQAKSFIKLEEEIFELEDKLRRVLEDLEMKEKIINQGILPTHESLFLELVKGFGVEFIEKDNKKVIVKNKNTKNVYSIDVGENDEEMRERIWNLI